MNPLRIGTTQALVFLFLLVSFSLFASTTAQEKKSLAQTYLESQKNEQVYLHTDRDVYAPNDTIWFKAYVRNSLTFQESDLSQLLYVFLVSKDSVVLQQEKCLIEDSQSKGFLAIEDYDTEGEYHIIAFSSWMNNFEPDCYFSKKILIRNDFGKSLRYTPFFSQDMYYPGDTVRVKMNYLEHLKQDVFSKDLEIQFNASSRTKLRIKPSDVTMSKPLNWPISGDEGDKYSIRVTDYDEIEKTVEIPYSEKVKLDFLPEGGNFVNGLLNTIAFKASYDNGGSATISGDIVNEGGDVLARVSTEHDGMGKFVISPNKGEKYYFKINTPEQCQDKIEIPTASNSAWMLNAKVSSKAIFADIQNTLDNDDICYVSLSVQGVFYAFQKVTIHSQAITSIPTQNIPSGIGTLTLLDNAHKPLAERLVFVNHKSHLNATLLPSKMKSLKLDSMSLDIKIDGEEDALASGQYSLSVYDMQLGHTNEIDEANIIASTYFNNQLKGRVNAPNYYFDPLNPKATMHLDLLLMVQGWRKYHYIDKLYNQTVFVQPFSQDMISGSLQKIKIGKGKQPIPGAVSIYYSFNSTILDVADDGKFYFQPEYNAKTNSPIMITGQDSKEKKKVDVSTNTNRFKTNLKSYLRENPFSDEGAAPFIHTFKETNDLFNQNIEDYITIEEVEVTASRKPIDQESQLVESLAETRQINREVLAASPTLEEIFVNAGINYLIDDETISLQVLYQSVYTDVIFQVDGIPRTYSWIRDYTPDNFEYFYISKGIVASQVYGSQVAVIIKLKPGANASINALTTNPAIIPRFQVYKQFYHPVYTPEAKEELVVSDARKTIYWNPILKVDEKGEASVSFYNAERTSRIKCVLQGITKDGKPVYGEAFYDIVTESYLRF